MTRALSSSGVYVGENVSERIQRAMRNMVAKQDAHDLEMRKQADQYKYTQHEEIWALVKTQTAPDGSTWYMAETVAKVPGVGAHVRTDRYERTARLALCELRFKIAKIWSAKRVDTPDGARARAAKIQFRQAIIGADDPAGAE
jgi:hypothetical protein